MDFSFLILFISIAVTILLFFYLPHYDTNSHSKLPPGPWQLPVIGNLHQLFMSRGSSLPHHIFHALSKTYACPHLLHLKLGQVSMVVASSPQAAKEILKTHDLAFATRPLFTAIKIMTYEGRTVSFAPYGQYWRQLRKICILELLSPKRVHSFRSIREDEVQCLIHSIMDQQTVNLSEMLTTLTNNIMTRAAVGSSNYKDQTEFIAALNESFELSAGFSLADLFPSWSSLLGFVSGFKLQLEKCHGKVDRILDTIIQQHKLDKQEEEKEEDLLDVLLRLQQDGSMEVELTADCIKAILLDMIGAGTETSSTTVAWAMSELMRNPGVMRKAQSEARTVLQGRTKVTEDDIRELKYMQLVIKETLRLHPPGPLLLPRECQEKYEILGYEIPPKSRLVVNAWAIGRDPDYWEDAEIFMPERFEENNSNAMVPDFKGANYEFLPFGAGRRMCPGISMGLAMVELSLAQLLYYFDWELPQGLQPQNLDMEESFGVSARRKSHLCLRPIPRINP